MTDELVRHLEAAQRPAHSPAQTPHRSVGLSVSETFEAEGLVDLWGEWRVHGRERQRSSG